MNKRDEEIEDLQQQNGELLVDLQRTRADFENYRKQVELQKQQYGGVVKITTIKNILPLIDDVERAIEAHAELKPLEKSLEKTMGELGLKKINSDKKVAFDPDLHEAVSAEGDGEKEVIAETLRPGYMYEGEVVRPAMVRVKKTS